MKKLLVLIPLLLIAVACSKKEKKLELFSPEAFAYTLESGWELNISCQAKGYELVEQKGKYYSKLSFVIDIKKPDGTITSNVQSGKVEQLANEEDADTQLNVQIKLDEKYKPGNYLVIVNFRDELTGKKLKIDKQFDLSE
jgi:hypothetical protein